MTDTGDIHRAPLLALIGELESKLSTAKAELDDANQTIMVRSREKQRLRARVEELEGGETERAAQILDLAASLGLSCEVNVSGVLDTAIVRLRKSEE